MTTRLETSGANAPAAKRLWDWRTAVAITAIA